MKHQCSCIVSVGCGSFTSGNANGEGWRSRMDANNESNTGASDIIGIAKEHGKMAVVKATAVCGRNGTRVS